MAKKEIKVGQVLYRPMKDKKICEYTITSIGSKYFYCDNRKDKYDIETMCYISEYSLSNHRLHLTKQEILDKWEREDLKWIIVKQLDHWNINNVSIEKLRAINNILNQTP